MSMWEMKGDANFVAQLATELGARIAPQKNIDMDMVPTNAYGVGPLAMATAARIVRPENTKNKIFFYFSWYVAKRF